MTEVLLYHHVQGLTEGVRSFADELRKAGHTAHTPRPLLSLRHLPCACQPLEVAAVSSVVRVRVQPDGSNHVTDSARSKTSSRTSARSASAPA